MTTNPTDGNEEVHLAAIDGDDSLQGQEDKLNQGQNGFTAEVSSYATADGGSPPNAFEHTNNATYTEVPIGGHVRPIHLVVVDAEAEVELEAGQELAFDSQVYVDGVVQRVVGYH